MTSKRGHRIANFCVKSIVVVAAVAVGSSMFPPAMLPTAHAAPGSIRVVKTEQLYGLPRKAIGKWVFYLVGPDENANGVFEPNGSLRKSEKRTNENGRGNWIDWDRPAGDYRLCERFWAGWKSNLGGRKAFVRPNGDRCVDFRYRGKDRVFQVNNVCLAARRYER